MHATVVQRGHLFKEAEEVVDAGHVRAQLQLIHLLRTSERKDVAAALLQGFAKQLSESILSDTHTFTTYDTQGKGTPHSQKMGS